MHYLVLYPLDDRDIRTRMARWLSQGGGALPLEEVRRKVHERFNYTAEICDEVSVYRLGLIKVAYKIKNGMVLG